MLKEEQDCQRKDNIYSVNKRSDFSLLKSGVSFTCASFKIVTIKKPETSGKKLGLAIKILKKTGNSVIRNRIRRRIKPIIKNLSNNNYIKPSVILIIARRSVKDIKYLELYDSFKRAIKYLMNKI